MRSAAPRLHRSSPLPAPVTAHPARGTAPATAQVTAQVTDPSRRAPIVVGLDPWGSSDDALTWAAQEARATGRPLHVLHAPAWPDAGPVEPGVEPVEPAVTSVVSALRHQRPDLDVTGETVTGSAVRALVEASATAGLLVIGAHAPGARPDGPWTSALWAALTQQVPMHARCPVVVVPPGSLAASDTGATVVVGVDDSGDSWEALRFAAGRATRTGQTVCVVHCAQVYDGRTRHVATRPPGSVQDQALLARVADAARARWPAVRFETGLLAGDVVDSLQRQSSRASLLVVGSRGRGGFVGLLLGSVSSRLVGRTTCPLVVIPVQAVRPPAHPTSPTRVAGARARSRPV